MNILKWLFAPIFHYLKLAGQKRDNECKLVRGTLSVQDNYDWAMTTIQEKPIPPDPPPL